MRKLCIFALFIIASLLYGENRWQSHGHNYSYHSHNNPDTEKVIFPVVWDVRSANGLLRDWQRIYYPLRPNPIYSILEEALESGFNTALIRGELGNKWFPDEPGACGDKFFPFAGAVRGMGLHIMVGGIRTELDQQEHNQSVLDYLKRYIPGTARKYSTDIIGFFAFDEPDVKYLENSANSAEWLEFVSYWSEQCRTELNLPVLSYFAKYSNATSEGQMVYYTDTTSVLARMARQTDAVGIDMYPVKNNFRRTDFLHSSQKNPVFTAATDILQTDPLQIQSLNSRDELIRVFTSGDSAHICVDNIHWNGLDLNLQTGWTAPLPFLPDGMASSDFRAGYAVQVAPGYVNSGVVLWEKSQPVDKAVVLVSNGATPVFCDLPEFPGSDIMKPLFFCVGQTDYLIDKQTAEGIVGRGRFAILAGMEDESGDSHLMFFAWDGGSLQKVFTVPRALDFRVNSAVWGAFWGTWYEHGTKQIAARNGFIIMGENGQYITLNPILRNLWILYPSNGHAQYSNLFGSTQVPDIVRVSRIDGCYPPFFAGRDQITGWFADRKQICVASSSYSLGRMNQQDSISIQGLPAEITGFDLIRNDRGYEDRPLFTAAAGDVYTGTAGLETGGAVGAIDVKQVRHCEADTAITGIRVMHTRDAIRSSLLPIDGGYFIPECEIYSDKVDQWRFQWYPEAHQVGMNLGIKQSVRNNTLFAVIQSFGRRAFALPTYCASPDTMLYLVTAPLVAGARGLVFYALDIAMMSGNGGDDGHTRAPFLLQNWGPSRDIENVDMVGLVHDVVARLTGSRDGNNGTDYLSALVDTAWAVMDDLEAFNYNDADTLLNFIALRNASIDTILIITVNEATSGASPDSKIIFQKVPSGFSIVSSEGTVPELLYSQAGSVMELDYSAMPGVSASLVTLCRRSILCAQGWNLSTATTANGITTVSYTVPIDTAGELALYDLTGRRTATLWSGTGTSFPFVAEISKCELPAGLYLIVLKGEYRIFVEKCVVW